MPSPKVAKLITTYSSNPEPAFDLPGGLTKSELGELIDSADRFVTAEELRVFFDESAPAAEITDFATRLPRLSRMTVRGGGVTDWTIQTVSGRVTGLTSLELDGCTKVTDAAVTDIAHRLANLTQLSLSGCREVTDDGVSTLVRRLPTLTRLSLWGCLRVTDAGVQTVANRLPNLKLLDLGYCARVTDDAVMTVADRLIGLTKLNLAGCHEVTDAAVQAVADKLTGLLELSLWGCGRVTDMGVTAVAERLAGLTGLFLSGCRDVTDVGVRLVAERLGGLTQLYLNGCNKVTDVGVRAVAEHLTALARFSVWHCVLVTDAAVQAVAEILTGLTHLELGYCSRVTDQSVVTIADRLPSLTLLDLRGCREVTDAGVCAVAGKLTRLTRLCLGGCDQITDLAVRAICGKLAALTHLDLEGCTRLSSLPERVGNLSDLVRLNLGSSGLSALPDALLRLPRLAWLDVSNVPGLGLPPELTAQPENPGAILDHYFRGAREGRRRLNEAKLILVGNEAVGKTSLVNFLVENTPCSDTEKTQGVAIFEGVDVTQWDVAKEGFRDALRLNVWDFGGQQVLYETHRFFLTARSLYLVVLEARRENENEQEANLHAWLRSIRARTLEDVPVIVVVNKAEPPHDLALDEGRLRREYSMIRGFIRTSCRDRQRHPNGGRGIAELRQKIVEVIHHDLPHVRDMFPVSYFKIKEQMNELARRSAVLNMQTYRKKCRDQTVKDQKEQDDLLDLLDRIGVVVKYNSTTLLDPNWLTTAVYRILTHAGVAQQGGEFSVEDIGTFLIGLNPKQYPADRWPFVADMMQRFGLTFELPTPKGRYLAPDRLPVNEPRLDWDESQSLRFRYDYQDTPPRGLLPRFIVEAHRYLAQPRTAWLSGAVLTVQGCEVLAKIDRHQRRTHISVRGPEGKRRDALTVVRELFARVHELYQLEPRHDVVAKIPVAVPGEVDAAFEFDHLETCERNRASEVFYTGYDRPFSVRRLLAGVGPEPNRRQARNARESRFRVSGTYVNVHLYERGNNMSGNINLDNKGGNIVGAAIGDHASVTAERIIANVRQGVSGSSLGDELKAILEKALEQLGKEKLPPEEQQEAASTVEKIQKELEKPNPNKKLVSGWVAAIDAVSTTVGAIVRGAKAIGSLIG